VGVWVRRAGEAGTGRKRILGNRVGWQKASSQTSPLCTTQEKKERNGRAAPKWTGWLVHQARSRRAGSFGDGRAGGGDHAGPLGDPACHARAGFASLSECPCQRKGFLKKPVVTADRGCPGQNGSIGSGSGTKTGLLRSRGGAGALEGHDFGVLGAAIRPV
jgi:hypothetical protein